MSLKEISFASRNGRDQVQGWAYSPIHEPRALIQLVHGFGCHSRRYLHMIATFQQAGFVVYADDHIGHGKTGVLSGTLGDPGGAGWKTYVENEHTLHDRAVADYPDLPYFMFGHSWGSMIGRSYAAMYGDELTGLMLCGLVSQMEGCERYAGNADLQKDIDEGHGPDDGMAWFAKAFDGMVSRYPGASIGNEWLAIDEGVRNDHAGDPFNCMNPTIQLVYDFLEMYRFVMADDWAGKVPRELPVYLISGDQDPCGNYGEGLYHVANQLAEAGSRDITTHAYTGYRHEIHNEPTIRDEVEAGLVAFVDRVLAD